MRCIEIPVTGGNFKLEQLINRNMRCIEIKGASIAFRGTYRLIETWDVLKLKSTVGLVATVND